MDTVYSLKDEVQELKQVTTAADLLGFFSFLQLCVPILVKY